MLLLFLHFVCHLWLGSFCVRFSGRPHWQANREYRKQMEGEGQTLTQSWWHLLYKQTIRIAIQNNDLVKFFKGYFQVTLASFQFLYLPNLAGHPSGNSTGFPSIEHLSSWAAMVCLPVRGWTPSSMRSGAKFISFLIISPASWQSAWRMVNTQQCLLSQLTCSKWFLLEIFFWPWRYQKYAYLKIWYQSFTNLASVCISVMASLPLSTLWQVGSRCSQPYRIPSFLPSSPYSF